MQIVVIGYKESPDSLWGTLLPFAGTTILWQQTFLKEQLPDFDLLIDFDFESYSNRIDDYKLLQKPVMIGCVIYTLEELNITTQPIARFNHWPTFQKRSCLEISVPENQRQSFDAIFSKLNLAYERTGDVPGFVTARILSLIINEAFFALEENVSTRSEIDTAMKLGTNYPMGPFEWCGAIGQEKVYQLLEKISLTDDRYLPAPLLKPI